MAGYDRAHGARRQPDRNVKKQRRKSGARPGTRLFDMEDEGELVQVRPPKVDSEGYAIWDPVSSAARPRGFLEAERSRTQRKTATVTRMVSGAQMIFYECAKCGLYFPWGTNGMELLKAVPKAARPIINGTRAKARGIDIGHVIPWAKYIQSKVSAQTLQLGGKTHAYYRLQEIKLQYAPDDNTESQCSKCNRSESKKAVGTPALLYPTWKDC